MPEHQQDKPTFSFSFLVQSSCCNIKNLPGEYTDGAFIIIMSIIIYSHHLGPSIFLLYERNSIEWHGLLKSRNWKITWNFIWTDLETWLFPLKIFSLKFHFTKNRWKPINGSYEKIKGHILIIVMNLLCLLKLGKGICKLVCKSASVSCALYPRGRHGL